MQAISWVIEQSKHSLGSFLTLLMIANHAKSDGSGAWPSLRTIAREARLSEREVRYCLRILEKSGELKTKRGKGPKGTNLYDIPGVRGANSAGGGGKIRQVGGQWVAPEPSLSTNRPKDKEHAQPRRASILSLMSEQEWQEHLNKLDPKRKGVSA